MQEKESAATNTASTPGRSSSIPLPNVSAAEAVLMLTQRQWWPFHRASTEALAKANKIMTKQNTQQPEEALL